MKIKYTIAALAATTLAANAATVIIDNYITEPNGTTPQAVGAFGVQSFTPTIAGLGTNDSVAANSPLPASMFLDSVTFLRAAAGNADAGLLFVDIYQGNGNTGTYLGSSINSIDVNNTASLAAMTWNFSSLALADTTQQYAFVFSTDNIAGGAASARLQVARNSAGAFANSYTGGTAAGNGDNVAPSAFDTRFSVELNTVPEPSSTALIGLGGLALILRRRK